MKFIPMTSQEQFDKLKKEDILIVKWRKDGEITHHSIWGINSINEVILNKRKNTYFSIDNYLYRTSSADEVYLVTD